MTEKFNAANTSFLLGKSHRRKVFLVNLYMLSTTLLDPNILSRVDENSSEYNGKKLAEKEGDEENLFRLLRTDEGDKHLLSMKQVLLDEYDGNIEILKKAFKSTDNSDKDDIENYFSEIKKKAPKKEEKKEYYGINKTSKLSTGHKDWKPEFIVVNPERPYSPGGGDEPGYRGKDIITGEMIEAHYGQVDYIPRKEVEKTINLLKEAKKKKDAEAGKEPGDGEAAPGAEVTEGAPGAEVTEGKAPAAAPAVDKAEQENNNMEELKKIKKREQEAAKNRANSLGAKEQKSREKTNKRRLKQLESKDDGSGNPTEKKIKERRPSLSGGSRKKNKTKKTRKSRKK